MQTADIIRTEDFYQVPTYNKYPIALEKGQGCFVWDTDGKRYVDFYGGHCVTALGHCPPKVVHSIQNQLQQLIFYSNVVYSPVRAKAAKLLASLLPDSLQNVYFCNSGTEANETALKLARTSTSKERILAMEAGFHGRTLGSLTATGIDKYRAPYEGILPPSAFIPFGSLDAVEKALSLYTDVAGIILEPIQSMAGVFEADIEYYKSLRHLCDNHNVALIFDEVQTGVGRTGTFSISEQYGIKPDLITMAKSLGSGISVGAVFVADPIARTIKPGDHGSTFGGGMISMAAVIGTVQTILDEDLMRYTSAIFEAIHRELSPISSAIRGRGCLIGIEFDYPVKPLIRALLEAGIIVGSSMHPNVIRLMPPINSTQECLDLFVKTFKETVSTTETIS